MYVSMTQQTNVNEEDLYDCKVCAYKKIIMISYKQKPWPIHVPAAAVIHEWRALFAIIERKKHFGVKIIIYALYKFKLKHILIILKISNKS